MRVLIEGAQPSEQNMERDAQLLAAFQQGEIPPTLRFYRWQRPTVSYGYSQRLPVRLLQACQELHIPLVRRPTGGKAVLHGHDLTLSLVFAPSCPARSPRAVYDRIAPWLIQAFERVGVAAVRGGASPPSPLDTEDGGDCFATSAITDIVQAQTGIKLVGCALRVTEQGTLMQASIPIEPPQVPVERLFGHPHPLPPFRDEPRLIQTLCEVFEERLNR